MADRALCYVTTITDGKGAYAIRADNDENVYIPVAVAEASELDEFDELLVIMVRNDRVDPPWRAIRVKNLSADKD